MNNVQAKIYFLHVRDMSQKVRGRRRFSAFLTSPYKNYRVNIVIFSEQIQKLQNHCFINTDYSGAGQIFSLCCFKNVTVTE